MEKYAEKQFKNKGVPRQIAGEEDAAIEAMYAFYKGMVRRKFPDIGTEGKLRGLLYEITDRRVTYWKRHCSAQKRGGGWIMEKSSSERQSENAARTDAVPPHCLVD